MRLIRDILKEKRSASHSAAVEPVEHPAETPEAADLAMENFLERPDDLTLEADLDRRSYGTADTFAAGEDEDDEIVFDNLKPLSPVRVPPRKAPAEVQMQEDESEDDTEQFDDAYDEDYDYDETAEYDDEQPTSELDDQAFMKRLTEPAQEAPLPASDPFDKLEGFAANASMKQASPSPLNSMRAQFREPPRATRPMAVDEAKTDKPETESLDNLTPLADVNDLSPVDIPAATSGRGTSRSGRVKTRLLGFSGGALERDDPFAKGESNSDGMFPVGWVVVVSEMGRGASFPLFDGVAKVGRGSDQSVCLNFGDNSISRDNHISIAYDSEQNKFFVGQSGKSNLVRLNGKPLLSTEELHSKDLIRLGETTLRFIAFCSEDFGWNMAEDEMVKHG